MLSCYIQVRCSRHFPVVNTVDFSKLKTRGKITSKENQPENSVLCIFQNIPYSKKNNQNQTSKPIISQTSHFTIVRIPLTPRPDFKGRKFHTYIPNTPLIQKCYKIYTHNREIQRHYSAKSWSFRTRTRIVSARGRMIYDNFRKRGRVFMARVGNRQHSSLCKIRAHLVCLSSVIFIFNEVKFAARTQFYGSSRELSRARIGRVHAKAWCSVKFATIKYIYKYKISRCKISHVHNLLTDVMPCRIANRLKLYC